MTQSPTLWTSTEADRATGSHSTRDWTANGVTIDSRSIAEGDLFIALKGPNHDGHDYVAKAFAEGASAAMVEKSWADQHADSLPLLPVSDTMAALTQLAQHKRAITKAKVIGITGSVGKTGTKETLSAALSRVGETHKTIGNLNNHIGLPLTLARLPASAEFAVLEMGMNHHGEIDLLSRLGRPDVAIITTVEAVHLEFFSGIEAIADAKAEIFHGMDHNGTAVLFRDMPMYYHLIAKAHQAGITNIISFGRDPSATVRLVDCDLNADGSRATIRIGDTSITTTIGAPGLHWVMNSLAVLAAVQALGADPVAAAETLKDIRAPRGRGARRLVSHPKGGHFTLIDESYNASPASMRAAIAVLGASQPDANGRRIAVLGDMRELGDTGPDLHAGLAQDLCAAKIDRVYCCGPLMKFLWDALPTAMRGHYAEASTGLIKPLGDAVQPGDVVTIKGSLGTKMAPIVDGLDQLNASAAA